MCQSISKKNNVLMSIGVSCLISGGLLAGDPPTPPEFPWQSTMPPMQTDSVDMIPGLVSQAGILNGIKHGWYLYISKSYDGSKAVPLVVSLHGASGSGLSVLKTGWPAVADREGFIVLSPDSTDRGGKNGWNAFYLYGVNGPDDVAYLKLLIEKICADYKIDKSRLYIEGQSRGNQMAAHFVSVYPTLFAAGAGTAGPTPLVMMKDKNGQIIKPNTPLPWYQWHGDLDTDAFRGVPHHIMDDEQRGYWPMVNEASRIPEVRISGRYTTEIYSGGKAEFRFTEYTRGLHSTDKSAHNIIWNDLFSRYTRSADGTLTAVGFDKPELMTANKSSVAFIIGTAKALVGSNKQIVLEKAPTAEYADKVLVPLSSIAQAFGAKVEYEPTSKQATIKYGNKVGVMTMNSPLLRVSPNIVRQIEYMNPVIEGNVVMVPIRPVAEWILGMHVSYSSGAVFVSNDPYAQIGQGTAHVLGRLLNQ